MLGFLLVLHALAKLLLSLQTFSVASFISLMSLMTFMVASFSLTSSLLPASPSPVLGDVGDAVERLDLGGKRRLAHPQCLVGLPRAMQGLAEQTAHDALHGQGPSNRADLCRHSMGTSTHSVSSSP
jgi:hypothetical protein